MLRFEHPSDTPPANKQGQNGVQPRVDSSAYGEGPLLGLPIERLDALDEEGVDIHR